MKVCVIGAGTMGAGIAQVFASYGHDVILCDVNNEFVDRGISHVRNNLNKLLKKEKINSDSFERTLARIKGTTDIESSKDCGLFIEAVVENIQVKKQLYKELDAIAKPDAILATNTSSLSITEIASATKNPGRVVGMHFFNPAPVMKLVEIVKGLVTDEPTVQKIFQLSQELGKEGVIVNEASGFIVNRMLIPMINEAVGILAEGIASATDIDRAMVFGANHPIGPLALADLIGNDVNLAIMNELYEETGDPKYRAHMLLKKMVRAGYLGRKSGRGFYDYEEEKK